MNTARKTAVALLMSAPLLLLAPSLRHAVESRMALHMLFEFPLLFAAGFAAFHGLGILRRLRAVRLLAGLDHLGIAGLTAASCVFAFWMIPAALDAALIDPATATAKYLSWWIAGLACANAARRAPAEIRIFFLGNGAWMSATAGLLYLDAPDRLCVNYLFGDQTQAGQGLLILALILIAAALRGTRTSHAACAT